MSREEPMFITIEQFYSEVRIAAYYEWVNGGHQDGCADQDWLNGLAQVRAKLERDGTSILDYSEPAAVVA
jgi:hypothetical protein